MITKLKISYFIGHSKIGKKRVFAFYSEITAD